MRWNVIMLCTILMLGTGCDIRKRESALQERATALNEKEQELILREKTLQLKEDEYARRSQTLDSTLKILQKDSTMFNPSIVGSWTVKMHCVETTCPGSAVGDTRTEQWEISYQNNTVVAKAMTGNTLLRIYTGTASANAIELSAGQDSSMVPLSTRMVVRLRETRTNFMEGKREIIRTEDCRIVYALELNKQTSP